MTSIFIYLFITQKKKKASKNVNVKEPSFIVSLNDLLSIDIERIFDYSPIYEYKEGNKYYFTLEFNDKLELDIFDKTTIVYFSESNSYNILFKNFNYNSYPVKLKSLIDIIVQYYGKDDSGKGQMTEEDVNYILQGQFFSRMWSNAIAITIACNLQPHNISISILSIANKCDNQPIISSLPTIFPLPNGIMGVPFGTHKKQAKELWHANHKLLGTNKDGSIYLNMPDFYGQYPCECCLPAFTKNGELFYTLISIKVLPGAPIFCFLKIYTILQNKYGEPTDFSANNGIVDIDCVAKLAATIPGADSPADISAIRNCEADFHATWNDGENMIYINIIDENTICLTYRNLKLTL